MTDKRVISRARAYDRGDPPETKDDQDELARGDSEFAKDYECAKCSRSFPTKQYLAQHLIPDKKKCRLCCKRFRHISNVVNHERVHTGEKPYICSVCRKAFSQVGNLRTHVRVHSGDRPYQCEVCYKPFKQMSNLIMHRHTHSNEKPYACDKCPKSYCQQYQLIRHQNKH